MIRLVLALVKYGVFAIVVIILSQWLQWDGMSVSDQVRQRMAHPGKLPSLQILKSKPARERARESANASHDEIASDARPDQSHDPLAPRTEALRRELRKPKIPDHGPRASARSADTIEHPEKEALLKVLAN